MLFLFLLLSINCNFLCKGKLVHYPVLLYLKPGRTLTDLQVPFSKILIKSYEGAYSKLTHNDFEYVQLMFKEYIEGGNNEFIDFTLPVSFVVFKSKFDKNKEKRIREKLITNGYTLIQTKKDDSGNELNFYKIGNYNALLGISPSSIVLILELQCKNNTNYIEWLYSLSYVHNYLEPQKIFDLSYYIDQE